MGFFDFLFNETEYKTGTQANIAKLINLNTKSSDELVLEIHERIDSAQERLLVDANKILSEMSVPDIDTTLSEKANKLSKLGFKSSKLLINYNEQAEEVRKTSEEIKVIEKLSETITHYSSRYPFLKFLTEDELSSICSDYNLVMGPVANYIKDVPVKNLDEIDNAQKLEYADKADNVRMVYLRKGTEEADEGDASKKYIEMARNGVIDWTNSSDRINQVMKTQYGADGDVAKYGNSDTNAYRLDRQGLFICAPKTHFNDKDLKVVGNSMFKFMEEPKDPIVFRYVKGGVQVLSKWGLEADDYRLQQPNLN